MTTVPRPPAFGAGFPHPRAKTKTLDYRSHYYDLDSTQLLVLKALLHEDERGAFCHIGLDRIAALAHIHRRTVQRALHGREHGNGTKQRAISVLGLIPAGVVRVLHKPDWKRNRPGTYSIERAALEALGLYEPLQTLNRRRPPRQIDHPPQSSCPEPLDKLTTELQRLKTENQKHKTSGCMEISANAVEFPTTPDEQQQQQQHAENGIDSERQQQQQRQQRPRSETQLHNQTQPQPQPQHPTKNEFDAWDYRKLKKELSDVLASMPAADAMSLTELYRWAAKRAGITPQNCVRLLDKYEPDHDVQLVELVELMKEAKGGKAN